MRRSADFQSAVSPTSSRQTVGKTQVVWNGRALRVGNPRSIPASANPDALALFAFVILLFDPPVGGGEAFVQRGGWLPLEHLLDECVVAVAAHDPARRAQVVMPLELHAGDSFDLGQQFVDGNQFAGAQINGRGNRARRSA